MKLGLNDIDVKYRIPRTGDYNVHCMDCVECGHDLYGDMYKLYHELVLGFCSDNAGNAMIVIECPKCFTKNRSHAGRAHYHSFKNAKEK